MTICLSRRAILSEMALWYKYCDYKGKEKKKTTKQISITFKI